MAQPTILIKQADYDMSDDVLSLICHSGFVSFEVFLEFASSGVSIRWPEGYDPKDAAIDVIRQVLVRLYAETREDDDLPYVDAAYRIVDRDNR